MKGTRLCVQHAVSPCRAGGRWIASRIPPGLGRIIVPKSIRIGSPGPKIHNKSSQIDPKSVRIGPKTLLGCRSRPGRPQGATGRKNDRPFGDCWGDPGRSKGRFRDPWKTEKGSQTDLTSVGRQFGEPKGSKVPSRRAPENISKNNLQND